MATSMMRSFPLSLSWRLPTSHFAKAEEAALSRLAAASQQAASLHLKSPEGLESCSAYLVALEAASNALQMVPASRAYRTRFPQNYRSLFPGEGRCYRADVLEASLEHHEVIWVNGEKFEFSAEAARRAENLQCAVMELGTLLERWGHQSSRAGSAVPPNSVRPTRIDVVAALKAFDQAWADFEERYICELAQIEANSRGLVVQAIDRDRRLRQLEGLHGTHVCQMNEYSEAQKILVAEVSRLNSVANISRKGRDDLRVEVLFEAQAVLRQGGVGNGRQDDLASAASILANNVVESFDALRQYLSDVSGCLERVDPHLGNNRGLVARLVDWEESWEVGTTYLQQKPLLNALCDAVAEIRRVQSCAPKLAEMFDECHVELFMVLPRLTWFRFLSEPQKQMPLLARLLPHRFGKATGNPCLGAELQMFHEKCSLVEKSLAESFGGLDSFSAARQLLAERIVVGSDDEEQDIYSGVPQLHRQDAKKQVESFMLELEAWSMELQRHCPEDWNQYSAVLVHCLQSHADKERNGPFCV